MIMDALKLPRVRMYWKMDTYINLVTQTMPRNQFFNLRTHVHVVECKQYGDSEIKQIHFLKFACILNI